MPCDNLRAYVVKKLQAHFVDIDYGGATYTQQDYDEMDDEKLLEFYIEIYGRLDD